MERKKKGVEKAGLAKHIRQMSHAETKTMKTTTKQTHLYSNTDLRKLLIPIIIEQLLSSLMGTVDTMMVSNVGSAAISAVSLVDSINILVIQALSALAAGGAILCSQYIGSEKTGWSNPFGTTGALLL